MFALAKKEVDRRDPSSANVINKNVFHTAFKSRSNRAYLRILGKERSLSSFLRKEVKLDRIS